MKRSGLFAVAAAALGITATAGVASGFPDFLMQLKVRFMNAEEEGIRQPFVGLHPSSGIEPGMFPISSTGVSTEPVRLAANAFLDSLEPYQLMRTQFPADDVEWRRWLNVDNGIYSRRGTPLLEMSPEQKRAAMALLQASLSAKGLAQSKAIMLTDQALRELNGDNPIYDPELYYFTVMGTPSASEPWGWQLDGHHLIINYFVLGDQVVMTPTFWGGEPTRSMHGSTNGNEVLQLEQDLGLKLMQALSPGQQKVATLDARKTGDNMVAGAQQDNLVLDYAGLKAAEMTEAQRRLLVELIEAYVGNMEDGHARVKMAEVLGHLDKTWFAWVGPSDNDAVFYYRIHSPVILIEFDHQLPVGTPMLHPDRVPVRDHIHTIVRTPNGNDYGKDLLAQHLAQSHSN